MRCTEQSKENNGEGYVVGVICAGEMSKVGEWGGMSGYILGAREFTLYQCKVCKTVSLTN